MIIVYHQRHPIEIDPDSKERQWDPMFDKGPPPWPQKYVAVAKVDTDKLEVAWEKTNHIDDDWRENEEVTVLHAARYRSSMVGDVFEKDEKFYVVAPIGFGELDEFLKRKKEEKNGA